MKTLVRFIEDESANTTIEYGLIITFVSALIISPLAQTGNQLSYILTTITNTLAVH